MYILYVFMKSIPSSVSYKNEILDDFIPRNGYLYVQSQTYVKPKHTWILFSADLDLLIQIFYLSRYLRLMILLADQSQRKQTYN